jgi:hypothetical protein
MRAMRIWRSWASQWRPEKRKRERKAKIRPRAVMRPLKGTMGRLARIPMREARWKWWAKRGSVARVAAREIIREFSSHRPGRGRKGGGRTCIRNRIPKVAPKVN